jgi:hypothetical protein
VRAPPGNHTNSREKGCDGYHIRTVSPFAACFGLLSTAVFAAGEIFNFSAALPVVDADLAKVIRPDVLPAIT